MQLVLTVTDQRKQVKELIINVQNMFVSILLSLPGATKFAVDYKAFRKITFRICQLEILNSILSNNSRGKIVQGGWETFTGGFKAESTLGTPERASDYSKL